MEQTATSRDAARHGQQAAKVSYADILRVGPGTIAGRYLRRFWHPVFVGVPYARPNQADPRSRRRSDVISRRNPAPLTSSADDVRTEACNWCWDLSMASASNALITAGPTMRPANAWRNPGSRARSATASRSRAIRSRNTSALSSSIWAKGKLRRCLAWPISKTTTSTFAELPPKSGRAAYFDLAENATDLVHTEYLHWHFGYKTSGNLDWRESDWA